MIFKDIKQKDFIIELIKDDLLNTRLVSGLEALGLDSGNYHLRLHEKIFMLTGIQEDEEFEVNYLNACDGVRRIEIFNHPERLEKLAFKLYNMLLKKSKTSRN